MLNVWLLFQAAAPSTDEVKPLLAADSLAPKSAPATGPTSLADQLDTMKGSGTTLQTSQPENPTEPPLDLFKGKEAEPASTKDASPDPPQEAPKLEIGHSEPQNPIDDNIPGTELAPDHSGKHDVMSTTFIRT